MKFASVGHKIWVIPEGYIPKESTGSSPEMLSHETACILNVTDKAAHVEIYIYFSDREPAGPFIETIGARRTKHLRFNDLKNPEIIPKGTDYASLIISDVPLVVQHTRLDSRQAALALLSSLAFGSGS